MSNTKKNLGHVTAYAYYKAGGGTMTEAEFTEYMADFGDAAERAVDAASEAATSEANAASSATAAANSASAALTSEENANGAMLSAYSDANRADTAADTATSAKNDAVSAKTAAQSAKTAAETAASTATTKATAAANSATAAAGSATAAANSATNAAASAQSVASSAAQITQNAEDIDALKEDLSDISTWFGVNQFDYTSVIKNKYIDATTGEITDNDKFVITDFIPCDATAIYAKYFDFTGSPYILVYFYDSSKNYLSRIARGSAGTVQAFNTVSGSAYIRIAIDASIVNISKCMFTFNKPITTFISYYTALDRKAREDAASAISSIASLVASEGKQVIASNYATVLPDANSAETNTSYVLTFASTDTNIPANLPVSNISDTVATLINIGASQVSRMQFYVSPNEIYVRRKANATTWNPWILLSQKEAVHRVIRVGANRPYTKLIDGIAEAVKSFGSVVYVDSGTYDLISEFGDDYFASITESGGSKQGIALYNNVRVVFSSNSKVVCNYTGSNDQVKIRFSPFNATGPYGFTLENLTLECSNVRYCVHDERSESTDAYKNEYINCHMYIDNSQNTAWASRQCIGGGLGKSGEIICKNCYFESVGSFANNGTISWHNTVGSNAKSRIVIDSCYFAGSSSTVRFGWYGTSTEITECIVCNNSFSAEPVIRAETNQSDIENMRMIAWNNAIRVA